MRVGFYLFIKASLKTSPNDKLLPSFKRGEYTYSNKLIILDTIIYLFIYFGKLYNLRQ
jgi:hypothetical protein